ncbi:hypothetical protein D3C87_339860 [compost metagenome]
MEYKVICPTCREKFSIEIFKEEGESQEFVYDCEVCCRPINVKAKWDEGHHRFLVMIDRGSGFDEMPYLG